MPFRSLNEFLESLASTGDLLRIDKPVDARQEIAEITRQVAACAGPALLFERVEGASSPVVTNLFGAPHRLCRGLGLSKLEDLIEVGESVVEKRYSKQYQRAESNTADLSVPAAAARVVNQALSQQVVRIGRDIDLTAMSAIQCWSQESGPTLWGRLIYHHPSTGAGHFLCRAQVLDRNRLALIDDGFASPALPLAKFTEKLKLSLAFVPGGMAEELLAACCRLGSLTAILEEQFLQDRTIDVAKAKTSELLVPDSAQMVIEGDLDADSAGVELQSAEKLGERYVTSPAFVMHVNTVTHRSNPIIHTFVHGSEHGDLAILHAALERLLTPIVRSVAAELHDFAMPIVGGWQRCAVLSIRRTHASCARRTVSAFWGLSWTDRVKLVIVVDEDVAVRNWSAVLTAVVSHAEFPRDILDLQSPADGANLARNQCGWSGSIAIDATDKSPVRDLSIPGHARVSEEIRERIKQRWQELGLPSMHR